ncbi:MAG: A24 family peptidase [Phycisphaerae bacterium]|nr:A24 family peptidase [Phycisphaerae bacterium]
MDSPAFWIIPVAVLGAVVGSFLNVVIFRLPRGLSISQPRWSFCPHCEGRVRSYHNVPILSWFWLRGRCRYCAAPIATVYPVIECATLLLFITVWDALFLTRSVPTVASSAGSWSGDWPMAIAYVVLFAGLLAISCMDIETYSIDIRVSAFVTIVGVACHAVWGIPAVLLAPTTASTGALPPALCLIGAAMGLAWVLTHFVGARLTRLRILSHGGPNATCPNDGESHDGDGAPETTDARAVPNEPARVGLTPVRPVDGDLPTAYTDTANQRFQPLPIAVFCGVVLALVVWQTVAPDHRLLHDTIPAGGQRGFVACFVLMLLLILASLTKREADEQIVQEIEAEREGARSMALREFAWFIPALCVGIGLFVLLRRGGQIAATWQDAVGAASGLGVLSPHVAGALYAVAGMVFAAALGWFVRILGTLAFGKEAFGTGDIHIMAAMGAVAGFWAVVFSFFLAAVLALIGVLATLFRKSSRAIPLGPWLAMGLFVTLWLQDFLLRAFGFAGALLWSILSGQPMPAYGG